MSKDKEKKDKDQEKQEDDYNPFDDPQAIYQMWFGRK